MAELLANNAASTLTAAIPDAVATTLTVANGTVFPASGNFRLAVQDTPASAVELMLCTARSGNTLTVQRGIEATTAAAHANGAAVTHVLTKGGLDAYVPALITVGLVGALVTIGTTLPASPVDGQEAILVDSLTAPTYQWRFRYVAGITDTKKWVFVGGSALQVFVVAEVTSATTGGAYSDDAASRLTVPRAGDYSLRASGALRNTVSGQVSTAAIRDTSGAFTPVGWVASSAGPTDVRGGIAAELALSGQTAGGYVNLGGNVSSGSGLLGQRSLALTPRRVA